MQRKPSFPIANCNIKMPDSTPSSVEPIYEEETEQRRQQLINFGHSQWGFNNWSWSVTKQELDFVDFANGLHTAGVVTFVAVTVKSLDIHRENIGYATAAAAGKGAAIYRARKSGVSNALRETLLAFGGPLAAALQDMLAAARPAAVPPPAAPPVPPQAPAAPLVAPSPARLPTPPVSAPPAAPVPPSPAAPPPERPRRPPEPAPPRAAPPVAAARPLPVAAALPMPAAGAAPPLLPPPGARAGPAARAPRPSNEAAEEEARAERRRRQRQAQEEFRVKQMLKQRTHDEKPEPDKNASSFDRLLMEIPTQDIVIEQSGDAGAADGKRKSPNPPDAAAKRRSNMSRLDIVQSDQ